MTDPLKRQVWIWSFSIVLFLACALGGCAHLSTRGRFHETGMASWYGGKFQGRKTASGELFDSRRLTAAHRTLPFGSVVQVHSHSTGKTIELSINDRGPQDTSRVIDLSYAAAQALGIVSKGTDIVDIELTN